MSRMQLARQRRLVGARLAARASANCSWFRRAACSFSCISVMRSRCGCRLRSACMRASSAARSCCVSWSSSWRASDSACSCAVRRVQQFLQAFGGGARFQRFQLQLGRPRCFRRTCVGLLAGGGDGAAQFLDAAALRSFRRTRASCAARSSSRRRSRASASALLLFQEGGLAVFVRALQLGQFHVELFELRFRFRLGLALLGFLRGDLVEVGGDLAAALVEARLDLGLLDHVDLQRMHVSRCRRRDALAAFLQAALQLGHARRRRACARARASSASSAWARSCLAMLSISCWRASMPSCSASAA